MKLADAHWVDRQLGTKRRLIKNGGSFVVLGLVLILAFSQINMKDTSDNDRFIRRRLDTVDFNVGIAELKKFKAANGNLMVPQNTVVEVDGQEIKLGKWSQRLRQLHKNTYITPKARAGFGQMTDVQKKELDAIGFMFELPDELKKAVRGSCHSQPKFERSLTAFL
jgi:hypothetical protein